MCAVKPGPSDRKTVIVACEDLGSPIKSQLDRGARFLGSLGGGEKMQGGLEIGSE